jgi:hypothetical protein
MTIKEQIQKEIELQGSLRGEKKRTCKDIAKEANIDYNGFILWLKDDNRSMGDRNVQKVVDALGMKFILISKNQ